MPDPALPPLFFAAAVLYSMVGHGGASAYLAAMALLGVAPAVMKPAALLLNVLVASIAAVRFWRAGWFTWHLFWPFAAASIPAAFLGGQIALPDHLYRQVLGVMLIYAALQLLRRWTAAPAEAVRPPSLPAAAASGAAIGLLSGLVGIGGGILLSPLMLLLRWADAQRTCAVAAPFIVLNSLAGLAGHVAAVRDVPAEIFAWAAAAGAGGMIGSYLGSRRLTGVALRRVLAAVVALAAVKLLLT